MIIVDNLSKRYGKQVLFDRVSFKVNARERVGVVGRNGHGKTTLFRLITGEEEPDEGSVIKPRNYSIGYVEQRLVFREATVLDEAARALPAAASGELWRVEKVLAGLGFGTRDLTRAPRELSGGFQVRLNLAKVLLGDYQMLLLDEPTNFLDITSIRWLEGFLKGWPGEVMFISHDRSFMDGVATHILGIHRKKVRKIQGDTGKYYERLAADEETYEKTRVNDERKRKEMEVFINRFRAKARLAGLVQSRLKYLEKAEKRERLEAIRDLEFTFSLKPFYHKYVMDVRELTFGYDPGRPLIRDFTLSVGGRDRVFVIGRNGRGKTTLLKLLAGVLQPQCGEVNTPLSAAVGYFEQTHVSTLNADSTVLEVIASADPAGDPKKTRAIAAAMLFEGDDALKPVRVLSGGEKSRVLLAKLIASPANLLLLDEPTNHLDLASNDALLAALDDYEGAVVMVTHNEMFLSALAERLVVFEESGVKVYEGGYARFLEKVGWEEEAGRLLLRRLEQTAESEAPTPKELRRLRSRLIAEKSRVLKPLESRMRTVEARVEELDARVEILNREMVEAAANKRAEEIADKARSLHAARQEMEALLDELEKLDDDYRGRQAEFEEKLRDLDGLDDPVRPRR